MRFGDPEDGLRGNWPEFLRLNACQVLSNAPRRVRWRDGAYVNLYRVKLIIERYSATLRSVMSALRLPAAMSRFSLSTRACSVLTSEKQ